jgi:hypothetical protein
VRRKKYYGLVMALLFLSAAAGDAPGADAGTPRGGELYQLSPPGTLQKIPAPPVSKPMPAQPAPSSNPILPEHRGALNPKTGEFYPSHGEGAINPRTGEFYPPSGSGYINPRTGEYYPGNEPGGSK